MFDGIDLVTRGETFSIPELNLKNRRKVDKKIAPYINTTPPRPGTTEYDAFEAVVIETALLSLCQNYPDFTEDMLLDIFTSTQLYKIFRYALGQTDEPKIETGLASANGIAPRPTQAPTGGPSITA